jgi:hypothetical protein
MSPNLVNNPQVSILAKTRSITNVLVLIEHTAQILNWE